jgi:hypothetical protein
MYRRVLILSSWYDTVIRTSFICITPIVISRRAIIIWIELDSWIDYADRIR